MRDPEAKPDAQLANALAFSVHIFTASGAVLALFALLAAIERDWTQTFLLLGAALFVDGIDATFACKLDRGQYKSCTSPYKVKHLDPGRHKLRVVATDAAGNNDLSPAVFHFKSE